MTFVRFLLLAVPALSHTEAQGSLNLRDEERVEWQRERNHPHEAALEERREEVQDRREERIEERNERREEMKERREGEHREERIDERRAESRVEAERMEERRDQGPFEHEGERRAMAVAPNGEMYREEERRGERAEPYRFERRERSPHAQAALAQAEAEFSSLQQQGFPDLGAMGGAVGGIMKGIYTQIVMNDYPYMCPCDDKTGKCGSKAGKDEACAPDPNTPNYVEKDEKKSASAAPAANAGTAAASGGSFEIDPTGMS